jgi:P-type Cu+ transporter
VAYLYSVVATVAPGSSRPRSAASTGEVGVYFEAAAVIVTLVLLGQVLELRARSRTGAAIRALLGLAPKTRGGSRRRHRARTCRSTQVQPGDRLRVRPGEKVPVDGVVVEGTSASTSRWSPASRSRSRRAGRPGHRRHRQRHRQRW